VFALFVVLISDCVGGTAVGLEPSTSKELPNSSQIHGVQATILLRTDVSNMPGKVLIVSRTTYTPGAHVAWHRHNSQVVFYVLQGSMDVQEQGMAPFVLKAGDHLLVNPGTVHQHWNANAKLPLVFLEYVLVDKGKPSLTFLKKSIATGQRLKCRSNPVLLFGA
jgi:quercetin dioxygenase-like cupin family protein